MPLDFEFSNALSFFEIIYRTMVQQADGPRKTSELQLSEIGGIQAPLRHDWAKKGRLRQGGRDGYFVEDAIELAALKALMDGLGPSDGPIAWKQIRSGLQAEVGSGDLLLVYDVQDKVAVVVTEPEALSDVLPRGRPIRVLDLASPIQRITRAFELITEPL